MLQILKGLQRKELVNGRYEAFPVTVNSCNIDVDQA